MGSIVTPIKTLNVQLWLKEFNTFNNLSCCWSRLCFWKYYYWNLTYIFSVLSRGNYPIIQRFYNNSYRNYIIDSGKSSGGSRGHTRCTPPLSIPILSFWACKFYETYPHRELHPPPPHEVGAPPTGKSWIRHWSQLHAILLSLLT